MCDYSCNISNIEKRFLTKRLKDEMFAKDRCQMIQKLWHCLCLCIVPVSLWYKRQQCSFLMTWKLHLSKIVDKEVKLYKYWLQALFYHPENKQTFFLKLVSNVHFFLLLNHSFCTDEEERKNYFFKACKLHILFLLNKYCIPVKAQIQSEIAISIKWGKWTWDKLNLFLFKNKSI